MTLEKNRKGLSLKSIFKFLYFSQCNYEIALEVKKKKFLSARSVFVFSNLSFFAIVTWGQGFLVFVTCLYSVIIK